MVPFGGFALIAVWSTLVLLGIRLAHADDC
jgi:hypothetical protein